MKSILAISLLILLMGFAHCNRYPNPQRAMLGRYELVGYDNAGKLIFTGAISLTSLEQNELKGHCKVVEATETLEGAVDKDGPCEGSIIANKVTLDLAPFLDDGGLVLEGQIADARITGIWMFKTFAGSKPQGKFEAVKKG